MIITTLKIYKMSKQEKREFRSVKTELRAASKGRRVEGYAVRFEEWSRDLGGFKEIIHAGAISQDLIDKSDVVMCINHDENKMLARHKEGKGTLELELKADGLYFSFDAPETELGNQLLHDVRSGNLDECSFAFSLDWDDDNADYWHREDDGLKREIFTIAGLYDCSIVTHAAYPTTSVSARGEQMVAKDEEVEAAMDAIDKEIDNL